MSTLRALGLSLLATFSTHSYSVVGIGDTPPNTCWEALEGPKTCLTDGAKHGFATVLLYNAGWCGPCNAEFKELIPAAEKFAAKRVVFISLSSAGWTGTSKPDQKFLAEWSTKFGIGKAKSYWMTAASPGNAGRDYFDRPSIPNVVVLDSTGKVAWKAVAPGAKEIVRQVEKVLR